MAEIQCPMLKAAHVFIYMLFELMKYIAEYCNCDLSRQPKLYLRTTVQQDFANQTLKLRVFFNLNYKGKGKLVINHKGYVDVGCGPWKRAEGKCYLFANGQRYGWSDARQKCLKAGADLVKVDDHNENVR